MGMTSPFIRLTGSLSQKPVYVRPSLIQTFGADPDNHDRTKIVLLTGTYVGVVIVDNDPDDIAETMGLKEIEA